MNASIPSLPRTASRIRASWSTATTAIATATRPTISRILPTYQLTHPKPPYPTQHGQQPYSSVPSSPTSLRYNRLIIGMTGASGAIYGIVAMQYLRTLGVETHLIMSKWAHATIKYETSYSVADVAALATGRSWPIRDMSAPFSSGSWKSDGMLIAPCSMKTLAAIRSGYSEDLISRSADVCIKERRPLVLVVRETPLSAIHLENMLELARLGVIIFPAVPAFYARPKGLDDIVNHSVARMLDCFGLEAEDLMPTEGRWEGFRP